MFEQAVLCENHRRFTQAQFTPFHAKLRWPKGVAAALWPMVLKHIQHLVNHIPGEQCLPFGPHPQIYCPQGTPAQSTCVGCPSLCLGP